jgi:8-oxo-dGTP diphosphatase
VIVDVVAAVLRRGDRLLLCHRCADRASYPDVWDLPGGHVDPGESPADALTRELREELGVDVAAPGPPFEIATVPSGDDTIRMSVWVVDHDGAVENWAPAEHDELRWVTTGEIAELELADPAYVALLARALAVRVRPEGAT